MVEYKVENLGASCISGNHSELGTRLPNTPHRIGLSFREGVYGLYLHCLACLRMVLIGLIG